MGLSSSLPDACHSKMLMQVVTTNNIYESKMLMDFWHFEWRHAGMPCRHQGRLLGDPLIPEENVCATGKALCQSGWDNLAVKATQC